MARVYTRRGRRGGTKETSRNSDGEAEDKNDRATFGGKGQSLDNSAARSVRGTHGEREGKTLDFSTREAALSTRFWRLNLLRGRTEKPGYLNRRGSGEKGAMEGVTEKK